jgi:hypothetical protein
MLSLNPMDRRLEEEQYLQHKRALLNTPGSLLNDAYYSSTQSTVSLCEENFYQNYYQSFSSPQFGTSSSILLPKAGFVGECYLHAELPATIAGQTLVRGWLFNVIDRIEWVVGSGNSSINSISGTSIMHLILGQCETSEKASEMYELAGHQQTGPTIGNPQFIKADILLPLPWSSAQTFHTKKEFDTLLLLGEITVRVYLKQSGSIYGGTTAPPVQFSALEFSSRTGMFSDEKNSLSYVLRQDRSLSTAYPFLWTQDYQVGNIVGVPGTGTFTTMSNKCSVTLQQFIYSDLLGIMFSVVSQRYTQPTYPQSPNQFAWAPLENIELWLNGNLVYRQSGSAYKLSNIRDKFGASFFHTSIIDVTNTTSAGHDSYVVYIDFARLRQTSFGNSYMNTKRIGNQVMNLYFNTPDTDTYTVNATYLYNGVLIAQDGKSSIFND